MAILVLASLVGLGAAVSAAVLFSRPNGTGRVRLLCSHSLGTLAMLLAGCMLTVGGCYKIVRLLYEPAKQAADLARVQLTLQRPLDTLWVHVRGPDPLGGRSASSFLRIQAVTSAGSSFTSQIPRARMEVESEAANARVYRVAWQAIIDHATTAEGQALAARLSLVNDFRRVVRLTVQAITPTEPSGAESPGLMLTADNSKYLVFFSGTASEKVVRDGEVWVREFRDATSPASYLDGHAASPAPPELGSAVAALLAVGLFFLLVGVTLVIFQHRVDDAAHRLVQFVRPAYDRARPLLSGAGAPLLLLLLFLLCFIVFNLTGLFLYLFLCLVSVAAGMGLLKLARLKLPLHLALMLAPVLTAAFWMVVLGLGVILGSPVRWLAVGLWAVTLALALLGPGWALVSRMYQAGGLPPPSTRSAAAGSLLAIGLQYARRVLTEGWLLVMCTALPMVVLFPYFRAGLAEYPGSNLTDIWQVVSYGQYLWYYPRGTDGDLAPLHQYGASFTWGARYMSPSILGFLSPLISSPGDTQAARGIFRAWTLFVFVTSCAFFGLQWRLKAPLLITYLSITTVSGWIYNLIWANNSDNSAALAYFPALAGAVLYLSPKVWSWRLILALFGAAVIYCYVELAPVVLGGTALITLNRCWHERGDWRNWALTVGCSLGLMLVLLAPLLPYIYQHWVSMRDAVASSPAGTRPGEGFFPGLLLGRYQPAAYWGLGGEWQINSYLSLRTLLALLLSALAGTGLLRLTRERQFGLAAVVLLLFAASLTYILRENYDYGAYKMILVGWWGLCFTVVWGLDAMLKRLSTDTKGITATIICTLLVASPLPLIHSSASYRWGIPSRYEQLPMSQFRSLEQVRKVVGDDGVIVAIDDALANQWAVYFLRDQPISIWTYAWTMQDESLHFVDRSNKVPLDKLRYVLTDDSFVSSCGHGYRLVWSGGPYRLWSLQDTDWSMVISITDKGGRLGWGVNQLKRREGPLWLDQGDTAIAVVLAGRAGVLRLGARFLAGPAACADDRPTVLVSTEGGSASELTPDGGDKVMCVPVRAGPNRIMLRAPGQPTDRSNGGEAGAPAFGIDRLSVRLSQGAPTLKEIPFPIVPTTQGQTALRDNPGDGSEQFLDYPFEKPQWVWGLRLRYSNGDSPYPARFQVSWSKSGRDHLIAEQPRNVCLEVSTKSGENTVTVPVRDIIDQFRVSPDTGPCIISEIVLLVPEVEVQASSGR